MEQFIFEKKNQFTRTATLTATSFGEPTPVPGPAADPGTKVTPPFIPDVFKLLAAADWGEIWPTGVIL